MEFACKIFIAHSKMKKRKAKRLGRRVAAMELPLRLRAAKLGAAANRNENLAANKAAMLRNDQLRLEQMMHRVTHSASVTKAAAEIKRELERLAKDQMP